MVKRLYRTCQLRTSLKFVIQGLQAANLGDSGFVLMRNGLTIFKSPVRQHQFNIPFQLESGGSDPPSAAEVRPPLLTYYCFIACESIVNLVVSAIREL